MSPGDRAGSSAQSAGSCLFTRAEPIKRPCSDQRRRAERMLDHERRPDDNGQRTTDDGQEEGRHPGRDAGHRGRAGDHDDDPGADLPGGDRLGLGGAGVPAARRPAPAARQHHPHRPRGGDGPVHAAAGSRSRTSAISSTARTSSPTTRARTATTTSASPPRPPPAGRSPGDSGSATSALPTVRPQSHNNYANQPQPITITSDYAEIIYFVRNGNLYRRVLLIVPEHPGGDLPADQQRQSVNGSTASIRRSSAGARSSRRAPR